MIQLDWKDILAMEHAIDGAVILGSMNSPQVHPFPVLTPIYTAEVLAVKFHVNFDSDDSAPCHKFHDDSRFYIGMFG
jgi:hypothetical protein